MSKTPNLRFKEFSGDWEEKELSDIGSVARGKSKHRPRNDSVLYGGNYPFIQTGDVKEANLYLTKYKQTYSEIGLKQSKLWNKGTMCITIAANIAETTILGIDACFPDSIIGFNAYNNKSDVVFIKNYFDFMKLKFQRMAEGVAQDNLNLEKLSKMRFNIPFIEEQNKIVYFLSFIDKKIENQQEKVELLQTYNKGMMQKIFSQELKFKGSNGEEYPEWEETQLRDILIEYCNKNNEKLYKVVTVGKYGIRYREDIYSKDLSKDISRNKLIFKDTLTIGMGSTQIDIGILKEDVTYSVSPAYSTFKIKDINSTFLEKYLLILNKKLSNLFMITGARQGKSVNKEGLLKFTINIPQINEQEKIANFLVKLDQKIDKEQEKLDSLNEWKKGLLQQMFV